MKRIYSIIALAIVFVMILSLFSGFIISGFNANAASVDSMQDELDQLAKEKEKLEKELNIISDKKEKELEKKSLIDEQINATQKEIELLDGIIDDLGDQLDSAEKQLTEAEDKLDECLELSKTRIRNSYEQGSASYLEIIAGSKSLYDFISKIEIVKQISEKDNEVINQVKQSRETIASKRKEIEKAKEQNEAAAAQLESKESSLEKKQAASDKLIDEMNSSEEAKKRAILKAEEAEERLQAEIKASLSQNTNSTVVDTGDFRWPLDSRYNNITSKFGYRTHSVTGVYKLHTGVDIASSGIRGTTIYAAKGGTVIKAGYNTGYGNYVVINHGDGYATLYGHASTLLVSANQTVKKGDPLGYVGSTGYSTGPHLHFEIMKNGNYTNPLDYYSGVMNFTYY